VERGVCDAAQAQAVLRHVEQTALGESPFRDETDASSAETPADD